MKSFAISSFSIDGTGDGELETDGKTVGELETVGYGDIAPATALGQLISSIIMIIGYGVIAIPTGIVSVEYAKSTSTEENTTKNIQEDIHLNTQTCSNCHETDHDDDANFCKTCGNNLLM